MKKTKRYKRLLDAERKQRADERARIVELFRNRREPK